MSLKQEVYNIASRLREIYKTINYTHTPLNAAEEQEKFFKLKYKHNPQFVYQQYQMPQDTADKLEKLIGDIKATGLPKEVESALVTTAQYLKDLYLASKHTGKSHFPEFVVRLHSWRPKVSGDYSSYLKLKINYDAENWDAAMIKQAFDQHLAKIGLKDWSVEISHNRRNIIYVTPNRKQISVGSRVTRSRLDTERLLRHEIDTHVRRKYKISQELGKLEILTRRPDKQLLEEGLAVYNEFHHGVITDRAKKIYALRMIACLHKDKSFSEIFQMLRDHGASEMTSYGITQRLKRGLGDTSLPGANHKDSAYLVGYETVKSNPKLSENYFIGSAEFLEQFNKLG